MLRPHDVLFGLLCLMLAGMLAFHLGIIVVTLLGAFACGSIYVLAGMMPSASDSLGERIFTSVFLSIVLSSLILILPGTIGAHAIRHDVQKTVIVMAALPPLTAICFEFVRTPRVIRSIRHWLGYD